MCFRDRAAIAGLAAFLFVGGGSLAAQTTPPAPPQGPELQRRQLELQARAALLAARLARQPRIECGMTVIPANPKVDPQAVKPVPERAPKGTIRQVPPPACR
jgi:hypothetical protein